MLDTSHVPLSLSRPVTGPGQELARRSSSQQPLSLLCVLLCVQKENEQAFLSRLLVHSEDFDPAIADFVFAFLSLFLSRLCGASF